MTEYNASDLLARLRADREGILATRRMLEDSRLHGHETSSSAHHGSLDAEPVQNPEHDDSEVLDEHAIEVDEAISSVADHELLAAVDLFADEEIEVIRAMRAKVERVEARLTSLHDWIAETRSWTERVELAQKAQRELGRLMLESQVRIDQQVKDAEERAARIVATAEEQAHQILAAAERAAAEVAGNPAAPAPEVGSDASLSHSGPGALSAKEAEAEELYEAIELFTRTNAELVNELSALISTIPARDRHKH